MWFSGWVRCSHRRLSTCRYRLCCRGLPCFSCSRPSLPGRLCDRCTWPLRVNTAVLCAFVLPAAAGNARQTAATASHWLAAIPWPGGGPSLVASRGARRVESSGDRLAMLLCSALPSRVVMCCVRDGGVLVVRHAADDPRSRASMPHSTVRNAPRWLACNLGGSAFLQRARLWKCARVCECV